MSRPPVKVYRLLEVRTGNCNFGCKHNVAFLGVKVLGEVVDHEITPVHGSADVMETEVRLDRQGRRYVQHYPVDFSGGPWWVREDGLMFDSRPKKGFKADLAADIFGNRLD